MTDTSIPFAQQHPLLRQLLSKLEIHASLNRVVIRTRLQTSALMGEQKQYFGLVEEKKPDHGLVEPTYTSYSPDTMMRWLVAYSDTVDVVEPTLLKEMLTGRIQEIIKKYRYE